MCISDKRPERVEFAAFSLQNPTLSFGAKQFCTASEGRPYDGTGKAVERSRRAVKELHKSLCDLTGEAYADVYGEGDENVVDRAVELMNASLEKLNQIRWAEAMKEGLEHILAEATKKLNE